MQLQTAFERTHLRRAGSPSTQHTCWLPASLQSEDQPDPVQALMLSLVQYVTTEFSWRYQWERGSRSIFYTLGGLLLFQSNMSFFKKQKTTKEKWPNIGNSGIAKKITVSVQECLVLQLLFIHLGNRICLHYLFPNSHWSPLPHQLMPRF